jgi:hypothetical protein
MSRKLIKKLTATVTALRAEGTSWMTCKDPLVAAALCAADGATAPLGIAFEDVRFSTRRRHLSASKAALRRYFPPGTRLLRCARRSRRAVSMRLRPDGLLDLQCYENHKRGRLWVCIITMTSQTVGRMCTVH